MHEYLCQFRVMLGVVVFFAASINNNSSYSEDTGQYELSYCEAIRQHAAKLQMCLKLEESILTYKELMAACPDDSLSKYQMGISYILLGKGDIGLQYMQQAIDELSSKGDAELAKNLEYSRSNWKRKTKSLAASVIDEERIRLNGVAECEIGNETTK